MKNPPVPTELEEQKKLFRWAEWQAITHPELERLFAIPNGGKRDIRTAAMLKASGVKPGVPDICLPVPRGGLHGLYIELKRRRGGSISREQAAWMTYLAGQGYECALCKGWEAAKDVILAYLDK